MNSKKSKRNKVLLLKSSSAPTLDGKSANTSKTVGFLKKVESPTVIKATNEKKAALLKGKKISIKHIFVKIGKFLWQALVVFFLLSVIFSMIAIPLLVVFG